MPLPDKYPANADAQLLADIDQHIFSTPPPAYGHRANSGYQQTTIYGQAESVAEPVPQPRPERVEGGEGLNGVFSETQSVPNTRQEGRGKTIGVVSGVTAFVLLGGFIGYEAIHNDSGGHTTATRVEPTPAVTAHKPAQHRAVIPPGATKVKGSPSTNASNSPSAPESGTPSAGSSTSASASTTPTPTDLPKFTAADLKGVRLDCAPVATATVSELIPITQAMQFTGAMPGAGGAEDSNTYTFKGGTRADIEASLKGSATFEVCVPDASKLFIPDPTAPKGSNEYTVAFDKMPMALDTSNLNGGGMTISYPKAPQAFTLKVTNKDTKKTVEYPVAKDAPQVLVSLCKQGAKAEAAGQAPTPVESQGCQDIDPSNKWSDAANPPISPIYNQLQTQVNGEAQAINAAEIALFDGQLDTEEQSAVETADKNYLNHGLQVIGQQWAKAESKKLGVKVPVPNLIVDQYSGDLPSQQDAYLAKNANVAAELDSKAAAYHQQHPKSKASAFLLNDNPAILNTTKQLTVTATEQH